MAKNITKEDLSKQLNTLMMSLAPTDQEATLLTLRKISDNIIEHPNDDKYRQIKLTGKTFSSKVWQYPAGEELMKMSGWVVEGDHVRLRDDSHVQIVSQLVKSFCNGNSPKNLLFKPSYSDHAEIVRTDLSHDEMTIAMAIACEQGEALKKILDKYDASSIESMRLQGVPLIQMPLMRRQIGIIRILVKDYGVDINEVDNKGCPYHILLFTSASDSSESTQSLIIEIIKEFNIDITALDRFTPALHYALFLKLFNVVKFLVEECKVNVNVKCLGMSNSTPLHVAYGMKQDSMIEYLIQHGADKHAVDNDGKKPSDYRYTFYKSENRYSCLSESMRKITKMQDISKLSEVQEKTQTVQMEDAINLGSKKHPVEEGSADHNLDATPTLNELNRYITEMAPSYFAIGLELDIVNSQLKLIKSDPGLPNLKEKCLKMLEVWLENDTSATWRKLCEALQEEHIGLKVLAENMAKKIA